MTQPTTGIDFIAGGFNDVDNRFNDHRTGLIAVMVRDARGSATDISPHNPDGSVKWSPLAQDGQLRADLRAFIRDDDGYWVINAEQNEGFHLAGAFAEGQGFSTSPTMDVDDQAIEQSNMPFDSEIISENEPFSFTGIETARPFMRRLRNNLRLNASDGTVLVEEPGAADAGWSRPIAADSVDRQVLLIRNRRRGGKTLIVVEGYSCAKLTNIGAARAGKRGEAAEMTFTPQQDGIFMGRVDGEYQPIIKHTWVGGDAWSAMKKPGTPNP